MAKRFRVIVSPQAEKMLLEHMRFLAQVSAPASKRFLASFKAAKQTLSAFPMLGPYDNEPPLPPNTYRKYLFYERYKILYEIEGTTVFMDAILDCRQLKDQFGLSPEESQT